MQINLELKKLIPPLHAEEYAQLEANILEDGCRDPLVLWQDTLIDGHNRYEICSKHNIPFKTTEKYFETISDAKLWMISNQNGRRNLTDGWKFELSQTKKAILLEVGRAKQVQSGIEARNMQLGVLSTIDKPPEPTHNTRDEIASELGWSTGKVAMADKVWAKAEPEVKQAVLDGEMSINEAYNTTKAQSVIANLHTGDEESYTPDCYIESARLVMGSIDLDPASNDMAQQTVQAKTYYTISDDGLTKDWRGNVFMNPPYTALVINQFLGKLVTHYNDGDVTSAIALTNSNTDTRWFHGSVVIASAICFTAGRINFLKRDGSKSSPTNGQMFFYFGNNVAKFKEEFSKYGYVMVAA